MYPPGETPGAVVGTEAAPPARVVEPCAVFESSWVRPPVVPVIHSRCAAAVRSIVVFVRVVLVAVMSQCDVAPTGSEVGAQVVETVTGAAWRTNATGIRTSCDPVWSCSRIDPVYGPGAARAASIVMLMAFD